MQTPVRSYFGQDSGAVALFRENNASAEALQEKLQEAAADLSELDHLIKSLKDDSAGLFIGRIKQQITMLELNHRRCTELAEKGRVCRGASDIDMLLAELRKEYIQTKLALRSAYREKGARLCLSDWQSPAYNSSILLGTNRLCEGIAEHSWDYKRDGHLDALAYEENFVKEYLSHLGSHKLTAYLTNTGMAAVLTALHWLAHEANLGRSALAVRSMYFENLRLAHSLFPNLAQLTSPTAAELLAFLRQANPSVVLCDPVTNSSKIESHDVQTILDWARHETTHELALVFDTTCLPSALLPPSVLADLPKTVSVLFVESLAKHHQFGMDSVTGGIVIAHMGDELQDSFRKTRVLLGTNISDSSVGALPRPNLETFTRRMRKHSRNVKLLAQSFNEEEDQGLISSISWLENGSNYDANYHGSCVTLNMHDQFRSLVIYRQLEQKILELCLLRNHPISFGTSFGFDLSRLYITASATKFEEPFLRIAVGTETREEIEQLAQIITLASKAIFNHAEIISVDQTDTAQFISTGDW
jgi:cystathionine beta-lyase/cystathionine gamma-synthase